MPAWLNSDGAWIALGISLFFLMAGFLMHRVFLRVLKAPHPSTTQPNEPHE